MKLTIFAGTIITAVVVSLCTVLAFDRWKAVNAHEQEKAAVIEKTRAAATEFGYLSEAKLVTEEKPAVMEEDTTVLPPATDTYEFQPIFRSNWYLASVDVKDRLTYSTGEYFVLIAEGVVPQIGYVSKAEPSVIRLADQLLRIDGILEVSMTPYSISIEKAGMHNWEDILPKVAVVLDVSLPLELRAPTTRPSTQQ